MNQQNERQKKKSLKRQKKNNKKRYKSWNLPRRKSKKKCFRLSKNLENYNQNIEKIMSIKLKNYENHLRRKKLNRF